VWGWLLLIGGAYPFWRAWKATVGWPLRHAVVWGTCAWLAWCWAAAFPDEAFPEYLASCLTACAGVAVLGARRPGAWAWNFVTAGLLVVFLRPLLEGFGKLRLEQAHQITLAAGLAVAVLNYLPTRQAPSALLLGTVCYVWHWWDVPVPWLLLSVPWLAWLLDRPAREDDPGELWRQFRDRHGGFWAARTREQFNTAAANSPEGVTLEWSGPVPDGAGLTLMRAMLKRFGPAGEESEEQR
jgi:hypothetical protein